MPKTGSLTLLLIAALSLPLPLPSIAAQAVASQAYTPDCGELCGKMREVVRDLTRIETPGGVQETYKTRIGGIDQWINVRGHHAAVRSQSIQRAQPTRVPKGAATAGGSRASRSQLRATLRCPACRGT